MSCGEVREMLGAHVLGALEPAEADEVSRHIEVCPACAEEYAQLRPLPGLLDLVPPGEVAAFAEPVPPEQLWRGLVRRAERDRAGRRRRSTVAVAGAVAAAGLLAFFGGFVLGGGDSSAADGTPSASSAPAAEQVSARNESNGVHAAVSFTAVGWGTKLTVALGGVRLGEKCSLVAVGNSGGREVAASWQVPKSGYPHNGAGGMISVPGAVGMQPSAIDHYEIITVAGEKLLTIPSRT